jgi:hypothetical protein
MSNPEPLLDPYDDDGAPVDLADPAGAQAAASALLEAVARERGLDVHRLDEEIVVCDDGQHRVLFHGLVSSASGRVAQVLCGNDAWLRGHLARHGLPVVDTRLVWLDDARFALREAEELGFPQRLRLAGAPEATAAGAADRTATDVDSFHRAWLALVDAAPDDRCQVILEHRPPGPVVDVAVVGDEVVALAGTGPNGVGSLALRAVSALPNAASGSVRIAVGGPQPLIDTVDLSMGHWVGQQDPDRARVVVAVLADSFGAGG